MRGLKSNSTVHRKKTSSGERTTLQLERIKEIAIFPCGKQAAGGAKQRSHLYGIRLV